MSERLLGAVVGTHGDDHGLIFPPKSAPIQVVIMPVAAHKSEAVMETVNAVSEKLKSSGYRTYLDDRDIRPGQKYYDWEIKGVPLRLEIGPRDIENGTAFAARRTGGKSPISLDEIVSAVSNELSEITDELSSRCNNTMNTMIKPLNSLEQEIEDAIIYEVAFDGNDSDAEILEKTTGLTILGDSMNPYDSPQECVVTGKKTTRRQHLARMY
jgi:prolyl-tRNA synthetase